jgi:hypothetical protein
MKPAHLTLRLVFDWYPDLRRIARLEPTQVYHVFDQDAMTILSGPSSDEAT